MHSANSPVFPQWEICNTVRVSRSICFFIYRTIPTSMEIDRVCRLVIQLQSIITEEQTQNKRTTWSGTLLLFPWIFQSWPNHRATSPTKEIRNIHQQAKNTWKDNQHCPYIEPNMTHSRLQYSKYDWKKALWMLPDPADILKPIEAKPWTWCNVF